jgi:hypothetical protein
VQRTGQSKPVRARTREGLSIGAPQVLAVPLFVLGLAAIIQAVFLIVSSPEQDLFDLTPKDARVEGYVLIAWYDLERMHRALKVGEPYAGALARVLGYMADGDKSSRESGPVRRFVLRPDAGGAGYPVHQFGDQMIDVHLREGEVAPFRQGRLVWVWGTWRALAGNPNQDTPLYKLENAHVEYASKADIPRYFR